MASSGFVSAFYTGVVFISFMTNYTCRQTCVKEVKISQLKGFCHKRQKIKTLAKGYALYVSLLGILTKPTMMNVFARHP